MHVIALKEILEEEKSVLCVIATEGLMDHIFPISACPRFVYQSDVLSGYSCKGWHCYTIYLW